MVWAWPLEQFFEVVRSALRRLSTTLTVYGGHERALAPLLLVLLFGGMIVGAFAGVLARGMAGGDVQEFLGGSWALTSQLVNQILAGGLGQESSYNVGIGDVRELVALPGEAPDVPTEGISGLLPIVLEVPQVSRVLVCALEVSHEDLL